SSSDFDVALTIMLHERTEVLLVSNDPLHQLHVGRIIDFLAKNRIAGMFQSKEHVAAGGFMARVYPTCSSAPPLTCTESCRAANRQTSRSSCPPSSIWRSTSRPPVRSASRRGDRIDDPGHRRNSDIRTIAFRRLNWAAFIRRNGLSVCPSFNRGFQR